MDSTDEALVARVKGQDRDAFALLYDRYARVVYGMAAHMLGAQDAEEVTQEVFLRLWRKAAQFDPARGTFGGWFMTIARNHVMDMLRQRSQHQQRVAADEVERLLAATADPDAFVEDEWHLRERGTAVLAALNHLPEPQLQAVILAYFGGMTQAAIAEQLDLPLGTVKKRIRLGLQKLRQVLDGQADDDESRAD